MKLFFQHSTRHSLFMFQYLYFVRDLFCIHKNRFLCTVTHRHTGHLEQCYEKRYEKQFSLL